MTKTSPSDPKNLVKILLDEVLRLRGRVLSSSRSMNEQRGLGGHSQGLILSSVIRAIEPPTVARIARSLGLTRQSVQRTANELAELGLIEFEDNPHHKRAKQLVATKAGLKAHASTDDIRGQWLSDIAKTIGTGDLEVAVRTLQRVRRHMEHPEESAGAAQGRVRTRR